MPVILCVLWVIYVYIYVYIYLTSGTDWGLCWRLCVLPMCFWKAQMIFGRQGSLKDNNHPGHWSTSVTTKIIEKVWDAIQKDHRLGVWAIAEMVNLGREMFDAF